MQEFVLQLLFLEYFNVRKGWGFITQITREGAMQAFMALRAQAKENGISDMSLDDINKEISLARVEADK